MIILSDFVNILIGHELVACFLEFENKYLDLKKKSSLGNTLNR